MNSIKSSLKKHCVAGPKSPSRCMSAKLAAIPPVFLKYPSGKAFYLALSESDLATPSLRFHLGQLTNSLETQHSIERSFSEVVQHLSTSNGTAHKYLRKFRDDFFNRGGKSRRNETSGIESITAGGISESNTTSRRKRTRTLRHRSTKVPDATMDESHDDSQVCENNRTDGICETTTPTVVQLRTEPRNIRRIRKTTTTRKETITKNTE